MELAFCKVILRSLEDGLSLAGPSVNDRFTVLLGGRYIKMALSLAIVVQSEQVSYLQRANITTNKPGKFGEAGTPKS